MPGKRVIYGVKKLQLIRALAAGTKLQKELAEELGVHESVISAFKKENAEQIARVLANAEDKFAGLIYADKAARLASYEADVEYADKTLDDTDDVRSTAALLTAKQRALRSIAEELNDLPKNNPIDIKTAEVKYVIEGINPDVLR